MSGIEPVGSTPLISVVIRLSDGHQGLRACLESLRAQSIGVDRFEVCVTVDGRAEEDALGRLHSTTSALVLRHPPRSKLKSAGGCTTELSAARGHIVFFMTGDEVLDAGCLEEHHRTHEEFPDPHVCVLGYTGLRGEAARSPLMQYLAEYRCMSPDNGVPSLESALDGSAFYGRVPSFKREFLLSQGALDPRFRIGFEWSELGYRLRRSGLLVTRNTAAVTEMMRLMSFEDACCHCFRQGQANQVLVQVHPEPQARAWVQIDRSPSEWEVVEPLFNDIMKSARELNRFAQERSRFELPIDELATRLLHRAYGAAFHANRLLGTVDGVVYGMNT